MFDTVALGELLIDFTPRGVGEQGSPVFEANPGGAPCNVLAALRRLGKSAAFIGKVGDDMFGRLLREVIESVRKEYGQVCQTALAETENYYVCTFLNTRYDLEMTQKEFEDYLIGRMWQDEA